MTEVQPGSRAMHQTTVRFGNDLWESLQEAAAAEGVSVAQYIREAAIARVAFEAGQANDPAMTRALEAAELTRLRSRELVDDSVALRSQNALARRRAQELRRTD